MTTESKPGYLIGLSVDLGSGRVLQFSTNLPIGADRAAMNHELDKLVAVSDRQQARCVIPALEAELTKAKVQRNACAEDLARLDGENDGKVIKMSERAARDNARVTLSRFDGEITRQEALLAHTRKQAE